MQSLTILNRFTNLSKLVKINIMLMTMLLIAATMTVSFATSTPANNCGARVALVLDRSSSIGVDNWSGGAAQSRANIDAIKTGASAFVDAVQGKDSYTDLYAFASVAQRINTVGSWFNLKDPDSVALQKWVIGGTKFKEGATPSSQNAYWDYLAAGSEGLTNWEHALQVVGSSRQDPFPTHVVMFTDGNPTTNVEHTQRAVADGLNQNGPRYGNGTYTAVGLAGEDGDDSGIDLARAVQSADFLRAIGIKVVPIGVGNVNAKNLQALAGPGNPVYYSPNYSELTNMFRQAAANVCEPAPVHGTVVVHATDEQGKLLATPVVVGTSGAISSSPDNGKSKTTSTNTADPWAARWNVETTGDWGAAVTATSAPAGYEPVGDRCRRDNWNNAGAVDLPQVNGSDTNPMRVDVTPLAKGGTVYCQFIFKKKFAPTDGIELTKTVNPTKAKRGEAVTYSFVVKNTGNTVLKNIKVNDPMLGGQVGTVAELAPGASSAPITKPYTIPSNASGTIKNVATVEGTPYGKDGKPRPVVKDTDDAIVEVELRGGQAIEKTVTPSVASVGQEVTYTIAVRNTGEAPISNVVVFDRTLNKEVTVTGPIAPGATGTVQIKHTLKAGDFVDGRFKNIACIKGTETCDNATVTEPKVKLTKSGPNVARPGQKVTFTFVVENTGKTDLTDHVITDETLSQLSGEMVEIKVPGTLKPGDKTDEIEFEFTIPSDFEGNKFVNVAVVKATPIDPQTGDKVPGSEVTDRDDHTIDLIRWETTKTADKTSTVPGDTVTYTITVKNTGGAALTNFEVSDPTINFPESGEPEVIELILPGESKSITVEYVIPANIQGNSFKNVALVCLPIQGQDPDCQEPEATVKIARISITKTADFNSTIPGQTVTYTFVVKNTGGVTLDPGEVTDDVIGVIGDPGTLEPGQSVTLTKEYVVPLDTQDGTTITNTATVCAPVPGAQEDEGLEETDCVSTCPIDSVAVVCDQDNHELLVEIPSITIVKTANTQSATEGQTVTYTFVVTNTSNVTVFDVTVVDNILGDLETIEKLEPGESAEKTVEYVVPVGSAASGDIRNVVTACFTTPEWEDNCATDDHTLSVVAVAGDVVERPTPVQVKSEQLPFTGSSSTWLATLAATLLGVGAALFMASRRRKELA